MQQSLDKLQVDPESQVSVPFPMSTVSDNTRSTRPCVIGNSRSDSIALKRIEGKLGDDGATKTT